MRLLRKKTLRAWVVVKLAQGSPVGKSQSWDSGLGCTAFTSATLPDIPGALGKPTSRQLIRPPVKNTVTLGPVPLSLLMGCVPYPFKKFLFRNTRLPGLYSVRLYLGLPAAASWAQAVNPRSLGHVVHTCIALSSGRYDDPFNLSASPLRVWVPELGRGTGTKSCSCLGPQAMTGCLALRNERMKYTVATYEAARGWMTCSFPQVFLGWRMSCSSVRVAGGQCCSAFHILRALEPAASSGCVSAHFQIDCEKKLSWVEMLRAKPQDDQPDMVHYTP